MIFGYTPTHPGEVLKDEIEARGMQQKVLAESMGMSYKVLNDILNERRPITTDTAMMFEAALDIPATTLLQLQMKYNYMQAKNNQSFVQKLEVIRKAVASIMI
ncbi:MAG: HigA family addiction module antidote protein [Bacteroidales bacterium]|nr:HigA family addiction module antidote protein [Candidatus Liminaster caballi]